jgi:NAD(P)H-dependent FMN reductase
VVLSIHERLDELPFYNEDLDTENPPAAVVALRVTALTEFPH